MSWIVFTVVFVLACLALAFVVTEWIVRRRRDIAADEEDSPA